MHEKPNDLPTVAQLLNDRIRHATVYCEETLRTLEEARELIEGAIVYFEAALRAPGETLLEEEGEPLRALKNTVASIERVEGETLRTLEEVLALLEGETPRVLQAMVVRVDERQASDEAQS